MNYAEAVLESAEITFRHQFEKELRQRLLDIATAEIEHIVSEIASKVVTHTRMTYSQLTREHNLDVNVKVIK